MSNFSTLTTELSALEVIARAFVFKRRHLLGFGCSVELGLCLNLNPHACFGETSLRSRDFRIWLQLPLVIISNARVFRLYSVLMFLYALQRCCHGALREMCMSAGMYLPQVCYRMALSPKKGLFLAYYTDVLATFVSQGDFKTFSKEHEQSRAK